jgi:hypothetical protein
LGDKFAEITSDYQPDEQPKLFDARQARAATQAFIDSYREKQFPQVLKESLAWIQRDAEKGGHSSEIHVPSEKAEYLTPLLKEALTELGFELAVENHSLPNIACTLAVSW